MVAVGSNPPPGEATVVLYLSYDGVLEPLGESQVLAYLLELSRMYSLTLLSFEKSRDLDDRTRRDALRARLHMAGIRWVILRYHKRPMVISTAIDLATGIIVSLWLALRYRICIAHARGYVASMIALTLKRLLGVKFLFDMRGFWPDEKVDAGHWASDSALFRITKRLERRFFESADAIVSLTAAGVEAAQGLGYAIRPTCPVEVIPTCTDLSRFRPGAKDSGLAGRLGVNDGVVVGCVGTMSNWYLRQRMLDYLGYLMGHLEKLIALIVTHEDHDLLRRDALAAGVPPDRLRLAQASFSEMPEHVRLMDLGLFFIKPVFSKKGSAATKLGEFLATGVPVIINDGVGDSGSIVRESRVGVVLAHTERTCFETSLGSVRALLDDPTVSQRCRQTAERWFDLREGVAKYAALYERLGAKPLPTPGGTMS